MRHRLVGEGLDRLSVCLDAASGPSARETWRKRTTPQLGIQSAVLYLCLLTFDFCDSGLRGSCGFCLAVGFVDASLQGLFLFLFLFFLTVVVKYDMFEAKQNGETFQMAFINCAYLCFSVLQKFRKSEDVAFYR